MNSYSSGAWSTSSVSHSIQCQQSPMPPDIIKCSRIPGTQHVTHTEPKRTNIKILSNKVARIRYYIYVIIKENVRLLGRKPY